MPKVLNKRDFKISPENSVYVGRPSKWGNPYKVGRFGTNEEVVKLYKEYLNNNTLLKEDLQELKGKDLVCWCSPEACHADILLEEANK